MDLSTTYLGLTLDSPLMLGASPLASELDIARRAEDSGASAIVMTSLFEEQISDKPTYYYCERSEFSCAPDDYLEQIRRLKSVLSIPVIASLNGATNYGWLEYAALIDQAGADALELNVYRVTTDCDRSGSSIEEETLDMVRSVVKSTSLPVAVKLSPFYTSLPNFAHRLVAAGAKGLVLFNRFYQPDIDLAKLEVDSRIELSTSSELPTRLRWVSILSPTLDASLAITGGVHSHEDVLKSVLVGAHGVQLVSGVLQNGVRRFAEIRTQLSAWLQARGYHALAQVRGTMNLARCADASAYERANYLHVLHSWPERRASSKR